MMKWHAVEDKSGAYEIRRSSGEMFGGIVIDSIPSDEYQETLVKAKALLNSIGANETNLKS